MSCHGIDGTFRGDEGDVGCRPYRVTRPTAIRVGPGGPHAPVVGLTTGQGVGRQTARNPDHADRPPDRAWETGDDGRAWIWVYGRRHGGSGWRPLEAAEATVSPRGRPCRGPAGSDFEPGVLPSRRGPHTRCGARTFGPSAWRRRVCAVPAVDIRWSPDGTAWDWLLEGDVVELRCAGPRGFAGVTLVDAQNVAPAMSGWVTAAALSRTHGRPGA